MPTLQGSPADPNQAQAEALAWEDAVTALLVLGALLLLSPVLHLGSHGAELEVKLCPLNPRALPCHYHERFPWGEIPLPHEREEDGGEEGEGKGEGEGGGDEERSGEGRREGEEEGESEKEERRQMHDDEDEEEEVGEEEEGEEGEEEERALKTPLRGR